MKRKPGTIITFYSYKGGTGRSMALANVAWILASQGKRVLMVDWDFEAPGLHRYFHPFIKDKNLSASDGLLELVTQFENAATKPGEKSDAVAVNPTLGKGRSMEAAETDQGSVLTTVVLGSREPTTGAIETSLPPPGDTSPDWYLPFSKLEGFVIPLTYSFSKGGTLDLMPAGKQDGSYAARVNSFNWNGFYDRLGGGVFLEAVKNNMREKYEYILIDSRTGVSDTAGICTVQMPDMLVVCFTFNIQSIEGASAVAGSIRSQRSRSTNSPLRIFPVPMRVDKEGGDKERLNRARDFAENAFSIFLDHWDERRDGNYWSDRDVPYDRFYALQEVLSTVVERPGVTGTLLSSFERMVSFLTNREITEQEALPFDERERVKGLFLQGAKPRTLLQVLSQRPEWQRLCDEVTARHNAWFESVDSNGQSRHHTEYLLNAALLAQLQDAIELLVAMREDESFDVFLEASHWNIHRQRRLKSAVTYGVVVMVLSLLLFLLSLESVISELPFSIRTHLWHLSETQPPVRLPTMLLNCVNALMAGALGATLVTLNNLFRSVQGAFSENLPFRRFEKIAGILSGALCGLTGAIVVNAKLIVVLPEQPLFFPLLCGVMARTFIPDYMVRLSESVFGRVEASTTKSLSKSSSKY